MRWSPDGHTRQSRKCEGGGEPGTLGQNKQKTFFRRGSKAISTCERTKEVQVEPLRSPCTKLTAAASLQTHAERKTDRQIDEAECRKDVRGVSKCHSMMKTSAAASSGTAEAIEC